MADVGIFFGQGRLNREGGETSCIYVHKRGNADHSGVPDDDDDNHDDDDSVKECKQ